jgi:hypothetical protein
MPPEQTSCRPSSPAAALVAAHPGDAFLVVSLDARFWDGKSWVDDWKKAQLFDGLDDPFLQAETSADVVRGLGSPCIVAYVPSADSAPRPRRAQAKKKPAIPAQG